MLLSLVLFRLFWLYLFYLFVMIYIIGFIVFYELDNPICIYYPLRI